MVTEPSAGTPSQVSPPPLAEITSPVPGTVTTPAAPHAKSRLVRWFMVIVLVALIVLGFGFAGLQLWAGYQFRKAREAVQQFHLRQAQGHLAACMQVWPNRPDVLLLAARLARRTGALTEASILLDRYEEKQGADDDLVLERVLVRAERGEMDQVQDYCQGQMAADHPTVPLILEALGRGFLRASRFEDAARIILQWLEREPENSQAWFLRGMLEEIRENSWDALSSYRQALLLDQKREDVRERLAEMLNEAGMFDEARDHLRYLLSLTPNHHGLRVPLARSLSALGETDEAMRLLDVVIEAQPTNSRALALRGRLARQAGQLADAERWLREAVKQDPGEYEGYYQLYLCLEQSNQKAEADKLQLKMKEVSEDIRNLRNLLLQQMPLRPTEVNLHYQAGVLSLRLGATNEAIRWFLSALRLNPEHVDTHKALADYYQKADNPVQAARHREAIRKAKQSNPGSSSLSSPR